MKLRESHLIHVYPLDGAKRQDSQGSYHTILDGSISITPMQVPWPVDYKPVKADAPEDSTEYGSGREV